MPVEGVVLVPVVLGGGLLLSALTEGRDVVRRLRGRHWLDRRGTMHGHGTAETVVHGVAPALAGPPGLRARSVYVAVAVVFGGLTLSTARGSWGNFVGWTWWARGISWVLVASLAATAGFAAVTVVAVAVAVRWPDPPAWTVPWLARTALARAGVPGRPGRPGPCR